MFLVIFFYLSAAGILGDSLSPLRHSMLRQLSWQVKPHGSLDLSARNSALLVVMREPGRLVSDPLENVVHKRVHNAHGLS